MKLRRQHVAGISRAITRSLETQKGVRLRADPASVAGRIATLLEDDQATERALEEEANRLLQAQLRKHSAVIDEARAFQLIKKELAKKRGFVL
ncbi:MAG: DUF507 family protein [Deltaproteobacteria bacterium]|nr:DUF507 family protein [Deltaproteobacteria bacterium]